MNDITAISKTFFGICIGGMGGALVSVFFLILVFQPPLFIPPTDEERQTFEEIIIHSNDIDGLRKSCAHFASCEDRLNKFEEYHFKQIEEFIKIYVVSFIVFVMLSAAGFGRIWYLSKK